MIVHNRQGGADGTSAAYGWVAQRPALDFTDLSELFASPSVASSAGTLSPWGSRSPHQQAAVRRLLSPDTDPLNRVGAEGLVGKKPPVSTPTWFENTTLDLADAVNGKLFGRSAANSRQQQRQESPGQRFRTPVHLGLPSYWSRSATSVIDGATSTVYRKSRDSGALLTPNDGSRHRSTINARPITTAAAGPIRMTDSGMSPPPARGASPSGSHRNGGGSSGAAAPRSGAASAPVGRPPPLDGGGEGGGVSLSMRRPFTTTTERDRSVGVNPYLCCAIDTLAQRAAHHKQHTRHWDRKTSKERSCTTPSMAISDMDVQDTTVGDWDILLEQNRKQLMRQVQDVSDLMRGPAGTGKRHAGSLAPLSPNAGRPGPWQGDSAGGSAGFGSMVGDEKGLGGTSWLSPSRQAGQQDAADMAPRQYGATGGGSRSGSPSSALLRSSSYSGPLSLAQLPAIGPLSSTRPASPTGGPVNYSYLDGSSISGSPRLGSPAAPSHASLASPLPTHRTDASQSDLPDPHHPSVAAHPDEAVHTAATSLPSITQPQHSASGRLPLASADSAPSHQLADASSYQRQNSRSPPTRRHPLQQQHDQDGSMVHAPPSRSNSSGSGDGRLARGQLHLEGANTGERGGNVDGATDGDETSASLPGHEALHGAQAAHVRPLSARPPSRAGSGGGGGGASPPRSPSDSHTQSLSRGSSDVTADDLNDTTPDGGSSAVAQSGFQAGVSASGVNGLVQEDDDNTVALLSDVLVEDTEEGGADDEFGQYTAGAAATAAAAAASRSASMSSVRRSSSSSLEPVHEHGDKDGGDGGAVGALAAAGRQPALMMPPSQQTPQQFSTPPSVLLGSPRIPRPPSRLRHSTAASLTSVAEPLAAPGAVAAIASGGSRLPSGTTVARSQSGAAGRGTVSADAQAPVGDRQDAATAASDAAEEEAHQWAAAATLAASAPLTEPNTADATPAASPATAAKQQAVLTPTSSFPAAAAAAAAAESEVGFGGPAETLASGLSDFLDDDEPSSLASPREPPQAPVQTSGIGYTVVTSLHAAGAMTMAEAEAEANQAALGRLLEEEQRRGPQYGQGAERAAALASRARKKAAQGAVVEDDAGGRTSVSVRVVAKSMTRRRSSAVKQRDISPEHAVPALRTRPESPSPPKAPSRRAAPPPLAENSQQFTQNVQAILKQGPVVMQDIWA